ncbi:hypothetical protein HK102_007283, partial [Quaeritorhiza haematococci]
MPAKKSTTKPPKKPTSQKQPTKDSPRRHASKKPESDPSQSLFRKLWRRQYELLNGTSSTGTSTNTSTSPPQPTTSPSASLTPEQSILTLIQTACTSCNVFTPTLQPRLSRIKQLFVMRDYM